MNIYCVNISKGMEPEAFEALQKYVRDEKQAQIRRFRFREDAIRSLLAELIVRTIIMDTYNIKNEQISFKKNEHGKPYIEELRDFHYNLSHSGDWVVCAADEAAVGIDVEQIKPIDLKIANRFFTENECKDILSKPEGERIEYFFDLWTLKESYIKACGMGLAIPLNSFEFRVEGESISFSTKRDEKDFYFKQYSIDDSYKLSVCSTHNRFPDKVVIRSVEDISAALELNR